VGAKNPHISYFISNFLLSSKKIQFSLLNPQDTVKLAEFEAVQKELYTADTRLPVKDGVLDRRLVSHRRNSLPKTSDSLSREHRIKAPFAERADSLQRTVLGTTRTLNSVFPFSIPVTSDIPSEFYNACAKCVKRLI